VTAKAIVSLRNEASCTPAMSAACSPAGPGADSAPRTFSGSWNSAGGTKMSA
jgi:hypothetical protein